MTDSNNALDAAFKNFQRQLEEDGKTVTIPTDAELKKVESQHLGDPLLPRNRVNPATTMHQAKLVNEKIHNLPKDSIERAIVKHAISVIMGVALVRNQVAASNAPVDGPSLHAMLSDVLSTMGELVEMSMDELDDYRNFKG